MCSRSSTIKQTSYVEASTSGSGDRLYLMGTLAPCIVGSAVTDVIWPGCRTVNWSRVVQQACNGDAHTSTLLWRNAFVHALLPW